MSTRSQIKHKDSEIYIYKHCDGYPEGVLPVLVPFVKDYQENRGCDDEAYFLCQCVREFARQQGGQPYTGWGLDCVEHGDIEYLYEIDSQGNIFVNGEKLESFMKKYNTEE